MLRRQEHDILLDLPGLADQVSQALLVDGLVLGAAGAVAREIAARTTPHKIALFAIIFPTPFVIATNPAARSHELITVWTWNVLDIPRGVLLQRELDKLSRGASKAHKV